MVVEIFVKQIIKKIKIIRSMSGIIFKHVNRLETVWKFSMASKRNPEPCSLHELITILFNGWIVELFKQRTCKAVTKVSIKFIMIKLLTK